MSSNPGLDPPLEEDPGWTRGEASLVTLVSSDFIRFNVSAHVLGWAGKIIQAPIVADTI